METDNFLPQVLVTLAANGGGFVFGILLGWSAPTAQLIVKQDDYHFWVTTNQFSWIVAMMALGAAMSCVLSGIVRSKIGTRFTVLLFGLPILIGWALITIPSTPSMLMIGRFLTGVSAGCYCFVLPIYVGEIASSEIRGSMLSLFQASINVGLFFVLVIGHFVNLVVLNIVCAFIPIIYSIGFLILPESPTLLISNNRQTDAKSSLRVLRGKTHDLEPEIQALQKQNDELIAQKKTFNEVFKTKSTKKAFVIIIVQFFFFQMSGMNAIFSYLTSIIEEAGISMESGVASIIVSAVQVFATFIAIVFVDRFGRKLMLSISNSFMCIGLIGIGTYFTLKDSGSNVGSLGWLPLLSLCVFVVAFSVGMGPVSYILLGELFLQDAKAYVAPIGQTVNFLLTFTIGLTFPMLTTAMGSGLTFFMFSGFCALAFVFTIVFIPETKGKSMAEIQKMLS